MKIRIAENAERRVRQIEQHLTRREFSEALAEAEKALKKYPQHFDVVTTTATAYMLAYIGNDDHAAMERSILLFQRAIPLLYQCTDERVCEASIMSTIGSMYIISGQTGKGLETLRQHNVCGTNNDAIGFTLAMRREAGEAKPFLYDAYASLLNEALYTGLGLILMYGTLRDEQYREAGTWLFRFLDSIELPSERITYLDKIRAVLHAQLALICAECGSWEESERIFTTRTTSPCALTMRRTTSWQTSVSCRAPIFPSFSQTAWEIRQRTRFTGSYSPKLRLPPHLTPSAAAMMS